MATKKLFLLDSFALIYRAYFAFSSNPLRNSKGQDVSAVHGFTSTLYELISEQKPTHLVCAFDSPSTTTRASEFDFYKANRPEMPEAIQWAIPYIKKIVEAFNIPIIEMAGYEADDIIGTIAQKAEKDGFEVLIVSPDKDFGQLVTDNIKIYKPAYLKNPAQILGVSDILAKWDIENTMQVIDMLGLMGDAADNIPGIPGVGEKTASKLLKEFGTVENLLENTHQLKGKTQTLVQQHKEWAIISKKLATIICDVPIEYEPATYTIDPPNTEALTHIFVELEFRTLGKKILGTDYTVNQNIVSPKNNTPENLFDNSAPATPESYTRTPTLFPTEPETQPKGNTIQNTPHTYHLANTPQHHAQLLAQLLQQSHVCFDTETDALDANIAKLVGMSFCYTPATAYYIPLPENQAETQQILNTFLPFFSQKNITVIGQNIKYDMLVLQKYGINLKGKLEDTMLMHYLLQPDLRHNMDFLAETYLGYTPVSITELIGKKGKNQLSMRQVPIEKVKEYAAEDADITFQLFETLTPKINEIPTLQNLYNQLEIPLLPVLTSMENEGVKLDTVFLKNYSITIQKQIETTQKLIFELANQSFNLDSPKQLGGILFEKLQIPNPTKKTKTGQYSTDEETLSLLAQNGYPIAIQLLEYRELSKLKNTYIDALPALVNPLTNRLHTTFNQTIAATGRLSSTNPNLQNIPIKTSRGKEIRKAFIAKNSDFSILSADYSQIELRLMAHFSQDENMIQAFVNGEDIHTATAAKVYNVPTTQVSSDMRRNAKMVNFGIIYGISAFGLSRQLGCPRSEAKEIIEQYFMQYPNVKTYMDNAIKAAQQTGYTETVLHRRRYLPDIHSKNPTIRGYAERNAINAPLQGSAADLIKIAMINIFNELNAQKLQSKLILQVHDELVMEVANSELNTIKNIVTQGMTSAMNLLVPLEISIGVGENWLEAH